jgi:glycosyltransferase involved in cell wall biosynthesis
MRDRPRALMACAAPWLSPLRLGSHQIARALEQAGWDVAYVSNPISPMHVARGLRTVGERFGVYRRGGITDLNGHLFAYVPGALATPHQVSGLRGAWLHRNWIRLALPDPRRRVQRAGYGEVDLLYFDSVIQGFWLDCIRSRHSVLRIPDRSAEFGWFTTAMRDLEWDLARRVDLVAYTAKSMEQDVMSMRPRSSMYFPNGVDFRHFAEGDDSLPGDMLNIPRPIAIYVGGIDDWFDWPMLESLAGLLPDVSFVLIGPDRLNTGRLHKANNIHLLGPRPYDSLPRYLKNANVGLLPFDVAGHARLVNGIHPLKLYEYLASGLPVVAPLWEEIASIGSPAVLCRTVAEQAAAITRVIQEPPDTSAGRRFAEKASWQRRVEELLRALETGRAL